MCREGEALLLSELYGLVTVSPRTNINKNHHCSSSVLPNLNTRVLMKMSRFWTKNEIPCHQHGKQDGELELTVVTRAVVASVVLKLPMGKSGVAGDSAVTAGTRNFCMKIHREPMSPAKASMKPTNSHARAPLCPKQPSV